MMGNAMKVILKEQTVLIIMGRLLLISFIALLTACSSDSGNDDNSTQDMGNIRIAIPAISEIESFEREGYQLRKGVRTAGRQIQSSVTNDVGGLIPSEIDSIVVDIQTEDNVILDSADMLALTGDVLFSIPAGASYRVRGRAFAGGELLFSGESELTHVTAGETTSVSLILQDQVQLSFEIFADVVIGSGATDIDFSLTGINDIALRWHINGTEGGSAEYGTIDLNGRYTPPATLPAQTQITVTAEPVVAPSFAQSFTFELLPEVVDVPNISPVADAGNDITVNAGQVANLSATASSDADGTLITFNWLSVSGDFYPTLSNANTSSASFTAPSMQYGGSAVFRINVTDNDGATASDTVTVTVNGTDQAVVADAGIDQTVTEGDSVSLNGSGSNDPDNAISSYLWEQTIGTTVALSSDNVVSPSFTAALLDTDEDAIFRLTVTNDAGLSSTDTVTIHVNNSVSVSSSAYFSAISISGGGDYNIWVTDGTDAGTYQLASVAVENGQFARFKEVNGSFYFQGDDGINGRELWRTDGNVTESIIVDDGSVADVDPNNFTVLGDLLLLGANTSFDGTFNYPETLVLDTADDSLTAIFSRRPYGGFGIHNKELGEMTGYIYFSDAVYSPVISYSLYRTDGVSPPTQVASGFSAAQMTEFTEFNGELFFVVGQNELWKTDGTNTGTVLLKTFSGHVGYSTSGGLSEFYNGGFTVFNNSLYFVANDGQGSELWVSNGVSGSSPDTQLVSDLDGNASTSSYPFEFREVNGNLLFFSAEGDSSTDGLWITDGTSVGTTRLMALSVGASDSGYYLEGYSTATPTLVTVAGSELLFFVASDGVSGNELWVTDGTVLGTKLVEDINTSGSSFPSVFRADDGFLIFSAQDDDGRAKLWRTDGTDAGTRLIKDICPSCNENETFFPFFG